MNRAKTVMSSLLVILSVLLVTSACKEDERSIFEKYGHWEGLETISKEGATDVWEISVNKDGDAVSVLESFYNESDIWVGLMLEGDNIVRSDCAFSFSYNGTVIGNGVHGGAIDSLKSEPPRRYFIMQPNLYGDADAISRLPDEFVLHFKVEETEGWKRTFDFDIPLKRSDREVIPVNPGQES
jgi:hypothetical protein